MKQKNLDFEIRYFLMRNAIYVSRYIITKNMFPDVLGIGNRAGIKHPLILEYVTKKLVRNFEGQNESIFRKLRGLNAEVVSYKK